MTASSLVMATFQATGTAETEGGFHAPGTEIFNFEPLFTIAGVGVTKPMLMALLGSVIVVTVFYAACANPKMVPGKLQSSVELGYLFIRDEVARSIIGKKGDKYVPLLVSLFFFIWILNLFAVIPLLQFPVTARISYPAVLALIVYVLFIVLGLRHQGGIGYFRNMMFPPGIPKPVYVLLAPLEFISTILVRPFTHAVRLFANMFAGHVLLAFFAVTAYYFIVETQGLGTLVGIAGFLMTIAMTGFEMFIQVLQAFIFTLLAAVYIQSSLEVDH
jgi:F-type H+-transporting ATPase subunit a